MTTLPTCSITDCSKARGVWSSLLHYLRPSFCTLSERRCSPAPARARASLSPSLALSSRCPYSNLVRPCVRVRIPCIAPHFLTRLHLPRVFSNAPCSQISSGKWQAARFGAPSPDGSNLDCPWEMAASGVLFHHLTSELVDTYTFRSSTRPRARVRRTKRPSKLPA